MDVCCLLHVGCGCVQELGLEVQLAFSSERLSLADVVTTVSGSPKSLGEGREQGQGRGWERRKRGRIGAWGSRLLGSLESLAHGDEIIEI